MRYTPFLDRVGVTFKSDVPDSVVNVVDSCLSYIETTINWGEHDGRERKPCPEQPILLTGQPLGQYHCPVCVEMQIAGMPHLPPDDDYEAMTGHEWPAGYKDAEPEQDDRW